MTGINIQEIRNVIVAGIYEHTKLPVVPTDDPNQKEKYPYYSYKFTSPYIPFRGQGNLTKEIVDSNSSEYEKDMLIKLETQPTMTLSFNAYSKDQLEAQDKALKAWEWFRYVQHEKDTLSKANIVVVDVMAIQDRTLLITDHYEYRYGFDVSLRVTHEMELRRETIEQGEIRFTKEDS